MDCEPVPLIATADPHLRDQAQRWCAALGVTAHTVGDLKGLRQGWRGAAAVILGADLLPAATDVALTRRDHVLVVTSHGDEVWSDALSVGAGAVCTADDEQRILSLLAASLDGQGEACVITVIGAAGGAGVTTMTAALALQATRRGLRSLAVDADPTGGGLDLALGSERADGLHWHDFAATRGRIDTASLIDVLPRHRGLSTLTWSRDQRVELPSSWPTVLDAASRGFDLLAVDLPRHFSAETVELLGRSVVTVIMVPEDVASLAAARQLLAAAQRHCPAVGVVSVARPGGVGTDTVARMLGMPVLARLRPERAVRVSTEQGRGLGRSRSLRRVTSKVLDAVGLERA